MDSNIRFNLFVHLSVCPLIWKQEVGEEAASELHTNVLSEYFFHFLFLYKVACYPIIAAEFKTKASDFTLSFPLLFTDEFLSH